MKKTNKKGFTIVELVIVIAVIAILAAVLIPTFSGIVKAAKLSADKQTVRQLNVSLAVLGQGDDIDYTKMADQLLADGYAGDETLIPSSKDHKYYWAENENVIVLADDTGKIIYPEDKDLAGKQVSAVSGLLEFHASNYVVKADSAEEVQTAVTKGNSITMTTTLEDPVVVSSDINIQGDVVYDLGENELVLEKNATSGKSPYINVVGKGNKLTITSGSVTARGVFAKEGAEVVIEDGVTIIHDDSNGGSPIRANSGSKITINGGKFEVKNGFKEPVTQAERDSNSSVVYALDSTIIINGGEFIANNSGAYVININGGSATINNATVKGARGLVYAFDASIIINGGTYEQLCDGTSGHVFCADDEDGAISSITVTGATYNYKTSLKSGNVTIA